MVIEPCLSPFVGEGQRVCANVRQMIQVNVSLQDSKRPRSRLKRQHTAFLANHSAGGERVDPVACSRIDEGHPRRKNLLQVIQFWLVVFAESENQLFHPPPVGGQIHLQAPRWQVGDRGTPQETPGAPGNQTAHGAQRRPAQSFVCGQILPLGREISAKILHGQSARYSPYSGSTLLKVSVLQATASAASFKLSCSAVTIIRTSSRNP